MTSDEVKPKCSQRAGRSDVLRHGGGEGNHVVLGGPLDFLDARDVERAALANVASGLGRDDSGVGHRLRRRGLDQEPGLVAMLIAPDPAHLRMGISCNHRLPSNQ